MKEENNILKNKIKDSENMQKKLQEEVILVSKRSTNNLTKRDSVQKVNGKTDLHFIGRRAAASPATGVFDRHLSNQQNIIRLATEANLDEIIKEKSGVSLVKYKLPIE